MVNLMDLKNNLKSLDFVQLHNEFKKNLPLGRILAMVEEVGCETIVIEHSPEENEFKKEFDKFYKNVFSVSETDNIQRLHFFKGNIESLTDINDDCDAYLGFCDIRPLKRPTLSLAIINEKVFIKKNQKFLFLVCSREFNINLGGISLKIKGFPYVQQDGRVVRCAQAALTSISLYLDQQSLGPDFTDITSLISDGHRPLPSRGMTGHQIGVSWEKLGLEPVLYDYMLDDYALDENKTELQHREQIIYRYLESGIPVLIGINAGREMHALVVIGHSFTPDSWMAQAKTSYYQVPKTGFYYHCCTNWIERFVVQDDNFGPYTLVLSDFLQHFGCKLITVGLPPGIYLMPEDAEVFVGDMLSPSIHDIISIFDHIIDEFNSDTDNEETQSDETISWYNEFKYHAKRHELVLRTYLKKSSDWIESVSKEYFFEEYKDILNSTPLPEYIWVVELSWPFIFQHSRKLCGVVIIDPTDEITPAVETMLQGWLWIQVPGLIMHRNAKNNEIGYKILIQCDSIAQHHFTCKNIE